MPKAPKLRPRRKAKPKEAIPESPMLSAIKRRLEEFVSEVRERESLDQFSARKRKEHEASPAGKRQAEQREKVKRALKQKRKRKAREFVLGI